MATGLSVLNCYVLPSLNKVTTTATATATAAAAAVKTRKKILDPSLIIKGLLSNQLKIIYLMNQFILCFFSYGFSIHIFFILFATHNKIHNKQAC